MNPCLSLCLEGEWAVSDTQTHTTHTQTHTTHTNTHTHTHTTHTHTPHTHTPHTHCVMSVCPPSCRVSTETPQKCVNYSASCLPSCPHTSRNTLPGSSWNFALRSFNEPCRNDPTVVVVVVFVVVAVIIIIVVVIAKYSPCSLQTSTCFGKESTFIPRLKQNPLRQCVAKCRVGFLLLCGVFSYRRVTKG